MHPKSIEGINSCGVPIYYTWVERANCGQNALSRGIRTEWDSNPPPSDYESWARADTSQCYWENTYFGPSTVWAPWASSGWTYLRVTSYCIHIIITLILFSYPQNIGLSTAKTDMDCHSALVLTLESSLISACYRNSLVTKGSFHTICLRFTEDFQMAMDDWRPASYDTIMNSCKSW